jgi:superfamily I DNA/RNA helicase
MDLALPLLEEIAPHVEPPVAYRTGADPPTIRRVTEEHLLAEAYREAARLGREAGLLALIVPDELVDEAVTGDLYDGVPVLTPRRSKGLEFDHVIVVEPALVAEKEQGLRELYVALTRPTKTLVVVHARPLPRALDAGATSSRA